MRFFCKRPDLRKFPLPKIDEVSKEYNIHQGNSGKCSKFTNKASLHAPRFVNSGKHAQKRPKMYVTEVEMHIMRPEVHVAEAKSMYLGRRCIRRAGKN